MKDKKTVTNSSNRPPIVAVLGHVDHGKTTLLDYIRKTNVVAGEHGGITQHIGAYQMTVHPSSRAIRQTAESREIPTGSLDKARDNRADAITFIDTPGHEAFMKMRARGATVADIAVLVVAADDSVKPQTKESIRIIKESSLPMIVAVTKIDLPAANIEKVKQDLARSDVQVEGFGGDVPIVLLSGKTGKGIDDLLKKIVSLSQELRLVNKPNDPFEGVVIETRIDKGKGMLASLIVKDGTLKNGMELFEGDVKVARIRALFDENGISINDAPPSKPVEVLGFTMLPHIGTMLYGVAVQQQKNKTVTEKKPKSLEELLSFEEPKKSLNIILKADTAGSLEAIIASLGEGVTVVGSGVGDVSEADILLAKSTGSFIVGFNIKWKAQVGKLAETEDVILRNYTVIYELLEELTEAIAGIKEVLTKEKDLGKGTIIAEFPFDGKRVAGIKVVEGRIAKGDHVRILREEEEVARAKIASLRQGKEDVTRVEKGGECGILFDGKVDFSLSDAIIAYVRN